MDNYSYITRGIKQRNFSYYYYYYYESKDYSDTLH